MRKDYPNSKTSLNFTNAYELLVGTLLSAQTTDVAVNKATPALFRKYPDVFSLSEAEIPTIANYIRSIGLYNNKAKYLKNMACKVVEKHHGKIPNTMKELVSLPGVGRKTANVVLGNAYGITSGVTVDTHMIRIMNLLRWSTGKNADKIEKDLINLLPKTDWIDITHLIIDHGRAVCVANRPKCELCSIEEFCPGSKLKL